MDIVVITYVILQNTFILFILRRFSLLYMNYLELVLSQNLQAELH